MMEKVQDKSVVIQSKPGTGEEVTRVPTTVSHNGPKQLTTIREAATLVFALTGANFMSTFAAQSVVILIPTMAKDLNIPETRQQWIVSAFSLTVGCFLVLCGKLGDVCGKKMFFVYGCIWIAVTSIATAFSPNEICLDIMRGLAGLGSAMTISNSMGILGSTIPPGRVKNYSYAFYSGGLPIGQVVGNILGGVISQFSSWKVVFIIIAGANVVLGILGFVSIPKERKAIDLSLLPQIDWIGVILFTTSLLMLLFALSEGNSAGWKTSYVIAILVISILMLIVFVFWQRYLEFKTDREPLLRTSVFHNARFSIAMVIATLFSAAFTDFLIFSTYFYQDYQLLDTLQTALRYIPLGVVGICTVTTSGYLLDRVRGNYLLIFGLTSATIACLLFAIPIPPSTTWWAFGFPAMILAAFGADTVYPCLGLYTTQSLPQKDQGLAGAMFQTVNGVGRAISLSIASAIQTAVQTRNENSGDSRLAALLEALRSVQWFNAACAACALLATIAGLRGMGKIGLLKKLGQVQGLEREKKKEGDEP